MTAWGPMTPHEKECAFAALALRIERAKTPKERREMKQWLREIKAAPLLLELGND